MKPDLDALNPVTAGQHRRRVCVFVALHVIALGALYAAALVVGGAMAGPPMPLNAVAMANDSDKPRALARTEVVPLPRTDTSAPTGAPDWARRAEIPAPWDAR